MNINLKKKRSLFAIAFLCLIVLVGITIAYFTSTSTLENIFNAGTYKTVTTEVFTSPSNWAPGDETPKTISTKNEGTIPVRVRVKFDESWTSRNDVDLPLQYNDENVAIINFDNEDDWIKNGDYYYYVNELEPGESTTSLIKSVTFNPNIPSDVNCTSSNGVYTCESTGDGYDGAEYKLNIITETVQANKYEEVWENVPVMYNYVGDNPCTYNGDLEIGTEYVNGQYTYRYRQETALDKDLDDYLKNTNDDGWSVTLTDPTTLVVNTPLCTSINNKPIVSMRSMFYNSDSTSIDLSSFDTSNVTNMSGMFIGNQATILDLSNFDTSKVRDMSYMFAETQATSLNLSSFDTSSVTDMKGMFNYCRAMTLNLSSFDTSNVIDMSQMFSYSNAASMNLSSFDTSSVINMNSMFFGNQAATLDLSSFDTSKVRDMSYMFAETQATTINISSFTSDSLISAKNMLCSYNVENIDMRNFNLTTISDLDNFLNSGSLQSVRLKDTDSMNIILSDGYCHPFDIYLGNSTTPENVTFTIMC